jgi:predicted GNAT family acetyltransferase
MSIDMSIEELIEEIKKLAENNIVVIQVVKRTSESFYNDRVSDIIVVYKPLSVRWEEPDPRRVKVVTISIGPFREYPLSAPDVIEEELKDYVVERIRI